MLLFILFDVPPIANALSEDPFTCNNTCLVLMDARQHSLLSHL